MKKDEFATIASALRRAYGKDKIMPDEEALDVWYGMLKDLDYTACRNAVQELIATLKFAPSIAEIRERASQRLCTPIVDWGEAWGNVLLAIRHYGYPREIEAMATLDGMTRKCVERLGYQKLCMSENTETDRANFRMIYKQLADRQAAENCIPIAVREERNRLQANLTLLEDKQDVCGEYPNQGDSSVVD